MELYKQNWVVKYHKAIVLATLSVRLYVLTALNTQGYLGYDCRYLYGTIMMTMYMNSEKHTNKRKTRP